MPSPALGWNGTSTTVIKKKYRHTLTEIKRDHGVHPVVGKPEFVGERMLKGCGERRIKKRVETLLTFIE